MLEIIAAFVLGVCAGGGLFAFGDNLMAWYFYKHMKEKEREIERLHEDIIVLQEWRNDN